MWILHQSGGECKSRGPGGMERMSNECYHLVGSVIEVIRNFLVICIHHGIQKKEEDFMKKKLVAGILAAVMTVSLAACGGGGGNGDGGSVGGVLRAAPVQRTPAENLTLSRWC